MLRSVALVLAMISLAAPPAAAQSGTFLRHEIKLRANAVTQSHCVAGTYVLGNWVTSTSTSPSTTIQLDALRCPQDHNVTITGSVQIVVPATIPPFAEIEKTPITVSLTIAGSFTGSDSIGLTRTSQALAQLDGPRAGTACPQRLDFQSKTAPGPGSYALSPSATATCTATGLGLMWDSKTYRVDTEGSLLFGNSNGFLDSIGVEIQSFYTYSSGPVLELTPAGMRTSQVAGGAGATPTPFAVKNVGGGTLNWVATPSADWIKVSQAAGSLGAGQSTTLNATLDSSALTAGNYSGDITFTGNATNSPQKFTVDLTVTPPPIDTLTVSSLTPDPSKPLSPNTNQDFSAQVSYSLQSLSSGQLLLQVSSGSTVKRATLPVVKGSGSPTLTVSQFPIPADAASLTVSVALLSDSLFTTLKVTSTQYTVVGKDSISFVPEVWAVFPAPDQTIQTGKTPPFCAAVDYSVGTTDKAEVYLQLVTGAGYVLAFSRQSAKVTRGKGRAYLIVDPFALDTVVALLNEPVTELFLHAFMSDPANDGKTLAKADRPVRYAVLPKPKITLKFGWAEERGTDTNAKFLREVDAAELVLVQSFDCKIRFDHRHNSEGIAAALVQFEDAMVDGTIELFVYTEPGDSAKWFYGRGPVRLAKENGQMLFRGGMTVPPGPVDAVYFRVRYTNPTGQQTLYDPVKVPYEGIWIDDDKTFPAGTHARSGRDNLNAGAIQNFQIPMRVIAWGQGLSLIRINLYSAIHNILQALTPGQALTFTDEFKDTVKPDDRGFHKIRYIVGDENGTYFSVWEVHFSVNRSARAQVAAKTGQAVDLADSSLSSLSSTVARDILSSTTHRSLASIQAAAEVRPASATAPMRAAGAAVVAPGSFLGIPSTWQFDPPIPADGSFSTDLTLRYSPADLQDDANYEEAKLTVISYDPATGRVESYPTTLDLANLTATAHIDRLLPYYSLAVLGPFAKATLNFPLLNSTGGADTALSLLNTGKSDANLSLRGYDQQGNPIDPATATIKAGQTYSAAASQVLPFPGGADPGWARASLDTAGVLGLEVVFDAKRLEAFASPPVAGSRLILPDVELNDAWSTEVHLANLTGLGNSATLSLRAADGSEAGTYTVALDPHAKLVNRIEALFPSVAAPFNGYLLVMADGDMSAAELLISTQSWAGLNASALTAGAASPNKLYSAQFVSGPMDYTRLNLVNPTNRSAKLVLRGFRDDGTPLGAPGITLDPGKQYQKELGALFGLDPFQLSTGAVVVESDVSGIVGDVTFGDATPANRYRSALMLTGSPAKSLVIPYLANRSPLITSVTAFNPNSAAATVQVKVLDADGSTIGNTQIKVAANGRASSPISQWIRAADDQTGGYITLDSDQPLTAFAAIGPAVGDVAAVAALPPAASAPPAPAQSPTLAVDPKSLDFGGVATGQTKALSLTVNNTGTATLTVTGINPASGAFPFTVSPTSFTVAAGGQQAVSVTFKPASNGAVQSSFTFASNDPQGSSIVVGLSGSGGSPPAITVTPARLDFGSVTVNQSKSLTVSIANTGGSMLNVSSLAIDNRQFIASASSANLVTGASLDLSVQFTPTGAGAQSAALTITSNDPARPSLTVPLAGTGAAATGAQELELKVDDGTFERNVGHTSGAADVLFVNRLTPTSYPVRLKRVRIYVPDADDGIQPGNTVGVVAGLISSDAELTATSVRLVKTVLVQKLGQWLEVDVPEQAVAAGTDIVVGFSASQAAAQRPAALDTSGASKSRSFGSANSGPVEPISRFTGFDGNLAIRAVVATGN